MSQGVEKYFYKQMDKEAGLQHATKRTKIVATVGPACSTYDQLLELVASGVNVFRLNFSHGSHEDKAQIIDYVRKINKTEPYNIALLGDLQGPKLRVGELENGKVELIPDMEIIFTTEKVVGNSSRVYVSYPSLTTDVKVGESILLDDGKMEVRVTEIVNNTDIKVKVSYGGTLLPKKGVNLPDTALTMPSLTEKDYKDLQFIIDQKIDWVALSFVRKAEDIKQLKAIIKAQNSKIKVIAKIEMPEALLNIRDIIIESDAIMIARGDLGVEIPIEKVPGIQKKIIEKCMHRAKPVIVATQMMESMIDKTKPNRSEATDVANAVLEGADAVMLSGETAMGNHPALVVKTMRNIILEVEKNEYQYNKHAILKPQAHSPSFLSDAICYNACKIANDVNATAIIGMTQSGYTGFMLSSYRPQAALFVFSKERTLINQLSLSWGVRAFFYDEEDSLDDIVADQIGILKERGFLKPNDVVVNTGSTPVKDHLPTNIIKISTVV